MHKFRKKFKTKNQNALGTKSYVCRSYRGKIGLMYIWLLCQNVTVFLTKTLQCLLQIQEKLETCRNLNLANFRRPSFGDDINVTFTSLTTSTASDFKALYTFYKFYPAKRVFLSETIPNLTQTFHCLSKI